MAKKSLNMIEKMMDADIIEYYIINCAIPPITIITIENRYQTDFGKPAYRKSRHLNVYAQNKCCKTCLEWVLYYSGARLPHVGLSNPGTVCEKIE